jgi:hypothetical protein
MFEQKEVAGKIAKRAGFTIRVINRWRGKRPAEAADWHIRFDCPEILQLQGRGSLLR